MCSHYEDLIGQKFNRLIVLKFSHINKYQKACLECLCDCGNKTIVIASQLKHGYVKSCGCLLKEIISKRSKKHGLSTHPLYSVWYSMIRRCYNKNGIEYKNYGARGIKVCECWHKFENFYEDMKNSYNTLELDRIDNNDNYYLENCRWVNKKIQARNRRSNVNITYKNRTQCLQDWANELNMKFNLLWERLFRLNWSIIKSFETPIRSTKRLITFNNETLCIKEWAEKYGISSELLVNRLRLGWNFERAIIIPLRNKK